MSKMQPLMENWSYDRYGEQFIQPSCPNIIAGMIMIMKMLGSVGPIMRIMSAPAETLFRSCYTTGKESLRADMIRMIGSRR